MKRFEKASIEALRTFTKLTGINEERFIQILNEKTPNKNKVSIGVMACMPKTKPKWGEQGIEYRIEGSGLRAAIDYKAPQLFDFMESLRTNFGVDPEMECLVADTEPWIRNKGCIEGGVTRLTDSANKVCKRIQKALPWASVAPISRYLPTTDPLYNSFFRSTYERILNEVMTDGELIDNPRIYSRLEEFDALGIPLDEAIMRSAIDIALLDTQYAIEGLWIANQRRWDAYLLIDNYPISAAKRTCRLSGIENISILFPVDYEIIE